MNDYLYSVDVGNIPIIKSIPYSYDLCKNYKYLEDYVISGTHINETLIDISIERLCHAQQIHFKNIEDAIAFKLKYGNYT
jgi:hypothetical protein